MNFNKFNTYQLLPYTDYESINRVLPAKIHFSNDLKELCYIAVNHTYNPEDAIFDLIEKAIEEFKPNLIMLEGGTKINTRNSKQFAYFNKILNQSKIDIIRSGGEFGFSLQLALQKQIEVFCPEPEELEQVKHLLQSYNIQEIFVSLILEQAVQCFEQGYNLHDIEFKQLIEKEIIWINLNIVEFLNFQKLDWEDFLVEFRNITNENFAECDMDFIVELNDPIPWKDKKCKWTITNQIAQEKCIFRDRFILNNLENKMKSCSKILMVYGGDHFYSQQLSLNNIFNSGIN